MKNRGNRRFFGFDISKKSRLTRDPALFFGAIPRNRSGQVWIETVIYTLIAFVMIGLVLSFAKPKIEEIQDKATLQQSTDMLKQIDSTILTIGSAGNQRIFDPLTIKEGELKIDGLENKIIFQMDSKSVYSEPGKIINDGNVKVYTEKKTEFSTVTLTLDYSAKYDIKFNGMNELKTIPSAPTPYKLYIVNEGEEDDKVILNMSLG